MSAIQNRRFIIKKKLGTYPYFTTIFSIVLALFVSGLFGLLIIHAGRLSDLIRQSIEIKIFLSRNISDTDRIQLQKSLSALRYVDLKNGSADIVFISKEIAADQLMADIGENFVELLGENPLNDSYIIHIKPEFVEKNILRTIKSEIELFPGVLEVEYMENLVNAVNANIARLSLLLIIFTAILLASVILMINNTIRLALYSQRFLIRSMQLVGATNWFIKRPFLFRALFQGMIGAILAVLMLYAALQYATIKIPEIAFLQQPMHIAILFSSLILLGSAIGFFSAYRSVNQYLKFSLDQLI